MQAAIALAFVLSLGCVSAIPTYGSVVSKSAAAATATSVSSSSSCSSSSSFSFYETNVCEAYGYSIREHLQTSIFDDIEQQFLEKKCELLSSYSVYPIDIAPTLDSSSPDSLCYDIIFVGAGPSVLSAIPSLLALNKKILIVESGYLPPAAAESLYYRTSLYESDLVRSYDAHINGIDITRKIYTANVFGGLSILDTNAWNIGCRSLYDQLAELNDEFAWEKVYTRYQSLECYKSYSSTSSVSVTSTSTSSSSSSSVASSSNSASASASTSTSTTTTTYTYGSSGSYSIFNSYSENYLSRTVSSLFSDLGYTDNVTPFDLTPNSFCRLPILGEDNHPSLFPYTVFKNLENIDNLDLALGTTVDQILFNGPVASGVTVTTPSGQVQTLVANEQVILGTGAVSTAKLLFKSGFGPQEFLTQHGITPIVPLPYFGQNLIYSPIYNGLVVKFPKGALINYCDSDARNLAYALGDYSLSATTELSYYRAYLAVNNAKTANVALKFHAFGQSTSKRFYSSIHSYFQYDSYTQEYLSQFINDYDLLFVSIQLLNPLSRGSIIFKDSPDTPYIDLGFYNEEDDVTCMLEAIEKAREIATTKAFSSMGAEIVQLPLQNINSEFFTTEFNRQSLLYNSIPSTYPAGGCTCGSDYNTAVVDKSLRVIGTQNLRIWSSIVSPYPLNADSIAFNTLIGVYGAEVLTNEYNGIFLDTIDISSINISTVSASVEATAASSYSQRDIDIDTSSCGSDSLTESATATATATAAASTTEINGVGVSAVDAVSASTSEYGYDASQNGYCATSDVDDITGDGITGVAGSSLYAASSEYAASESQYAASKTNVSEYDGVNGASMYSASEFESKKQSEYAAKNSSFVSGAGGKYVSGSSESYQAESEVSSEASSFSAANGSVQASKSKYEAESSQKYEKASYSAGAADLLTC